MSPAIVYGGGGCLGIVILLLAVVSFGAAISRVHLALSAPSFAETQGTVTGANIKSNDGRYVTTLKYRYVVASEEHTGSAELGPAQSDGSKAQALVKQHPVGSTIPVYYDPGKPSRSLLDRHVQVLSPGLLGALWPILFLGAVVVIAIRLHRKRSNARAPAAGLPQ